MVVTTENEEVPKEERWQKNVKTFNGGILHLFKSGVFSDIDFIVDGRTFSGHRLILGSRSEEFTKMLLKENPPRKIICEEVSEKGFAILFRYCYTDELVATKPDEILEAYRAARRFKQNELLEKCGNLIMEWDISCDNVCTILNEVSDILILRQRCLKFVSENNEAVLASKGFLIVTPNTLLDMFSHGCFDNVAVLFLMNNVLRWGTEQFPKLEDYAQVRQLLLDIGVLGKLKFHDLSGADLLTIIDEYPELLTAVEYVQFNLHTKNPNKPLPKWCEA